VRHLFAFGGDGTLHSLVHSRLFGYEVFFGIIPAGGGNDFFARALNLPLDPLRAISAAFNRFFPLVLSDPHSVWRTRFYLGGGGVGLDSESPNLQIIATKTGTVASDMFRRRYMLIAIKSHNAFA